MFSGQYIQSLFCHLTPCCTLTLSNYSIKNNNSSKNATLEHAGSVWYKADAEKSQVRRRQTGSVEEVVSVGGCQKQEKMKANERGCLWSDSWVF